MRCDSGFDVALRDIDVVFRKKKNFFDKGRKQGIDAQMMARSHSTHVQSQTE
jgi:hypothetical protein